MDLADIRQAIDGIDTTLLNSFVERMDIATEVAKSKIEMGKAVFDPARERSKLNNLASRAPEAHEAQTITLFRLLMSMSKAEQQRYIQRAQGHHRLAKGPRHGCSLRHAPSLKRPPLPARA